MARTSLQTTSYRSQSATTDGERDGGDESADAGGGGCCCLNKRSLMGPHFGPLFFNIQIF